MHRRQRAFALECVRILVEEYGARREGIDVEHFFYGRIGQELANARRGKVMQTPRQMVERALAIVSPWALGLAPATERQQARMDARWDAVGWPPEPVGVVLELVERVDKEARVGERERVLA
jgi:hypothetical protein